MKLILLVFTAMIISTVSHAKSCTELELKSVVREQLDKELASPGMKSHDFAAAFQAERQSPNNILVKFYIQFKKPDITRGRFDAPQDGARVRYVGEILTDRASCSVVMHKDFYGNEVVYQFQALKVTPIHGAW